ncbi:hypothetical protein CON36_36700, partial [Bacillus cereus]
MKGLILEEKKKFFVVFGSEGDFLRVNKNTFSNKQVGEEIVFTTDDLYINNFKSIFSGYSRAGFLLVPTLIAAFFILNMSGLDITKMIYSFTGNQSNVKSNFAMGREPHKKDLPEDNSSDQDETTSPTIPFITDDDPNVAFAQTIKGTHSNKGNNNDVDVSNLRDSNDSINTYLLDTKTGVIYNTTKMSSLLSETEKSNNVLLNKQTDKTSFEGHNGIGSINRWDGIKPNNTNKETGSNNLLNENETNNEQDVTGSNNESHENVTNNGQGGKPGGKDPLDPTKTDDGYIAGIDLDKEKDKEKDKNKDKDKEPGK